MQSYENVISDEQKTKKKHKKLKIFLCIVGSLIVLFVALCLYWGMPSTQYREAVNCLDDKRYSEAIYWFEGLGDYKDSANLLLEAYYYHGRSLYFDGNVIFAKEYLEKASGYEDAEGYLKEANSLIPLQGTWKVEDITSGYASTLGSRMVITGTDFYTIEEFYDYNRTTKTRGALKSRYISDRKGVSFINDSKTKFTVHIWRNEETPSIYYEIKGDKLYTYIFDDEKGKYKDNYIYEKESDSTEVPSPYYQ